MLHAIALRSQEKTHVPIEFLRSLLSRVAPAIFWRFSGGVPPDGSRRALLVVPVWRGSRGEGVGFVQIFLDPIWWRSESVLERIFLLRTSPRCACRRGVGVCGSALLHSAPARKITNSKSTPKTWCNWGRRECEEDTSYFACRHAWNSTDGKIHASPKDFNGSSDTGSMSCSTSPNSYGDDEDACNLQLVTWVHKNFHGILTNETKCLRCETVTARDETFFYLSLDIEQNSSITSCLKIFSSTDFEC